MFFRNGRSLSLDGVERKRKWQQCGDDSGCGACKQEKALKIYASLGVRHLCVGICGTSDIIYVEKLQSKFQWPCHLGTVFLYILEYEKVLHVHVQTIFETKNCTSDEISLSCLMFCSSAFVTPNDLRTSDKKNQQRHFHFFRYIFCESRSIPLSPSWHGCITSVCIWCWRMDFCVTDKISTLSCSFSYGARGEPLNRVAEEASTWLLPCWQPFGY